MLVGEPLTMSAYSYKVHKLKQSGTSFSPDVCRCTWCVCVSEQERKVHIQASDIITEPIQLTGVYQTPDSVLTPSDHKHKKHTSAHTTMTSLVKKDCMNVFQQYPHLLHNP